MANRTYDIEEASVNEFPTVFSCFLFKVLIKKALSVHAPWLKSLWCISPMLLFSNWALSSFLWPHEPQHARLHCPLSPMVRSNLCPLSQWYYPSISSFITPFFCPRSYLASGSFPMSQRFVSSGRRIGTSASVLPMNNQDRFPLELTGLIALLSNWSRNLSSSWSWRINFMNMQILMVASK